MVICYKLFNMLITVKITSGIKKKPKPPYNQEVVFYSTIG